MDQANRSLLEAAGSGDVEKLQVDHLCTPLRIRGRYASVIGRAADCRRRSQQAPNWNTDMGTAARRAASVPHPAPQPCVGRIIELCKTCKTPNQDRASPQRRRPLGLRRGRWGFVGQKVKQALAQPGAFSPAEHDCGAAALTALTR